MSTTLPILNNLNSTEYQTLQASYRLYVDYIKSLNKAQATILAYSKDLEQVVQYLASRGVNELEQVKPEHIDEFKQLLHTQRYSSKSISRKLNSIKGYFKFLVKHKILTHSPAEFVVHPKIDHQPPRVLAKIEYRALRDACRADLRIFAIVELLLQTGMRIGEVANLKIDGLDIERGILTIRPQDSHEGRKVPLNKAAKNALIEYLKVRPRSREKALFVTKTCRPFLVRNIRNVIDRYFRLAGISGAKVNNLRDTFIVEQLKAGTPIVYIAQMVGHKRIITTEKYLDYISSDEIAPKVTIEEL